MEQRLTNPDRFNPGGGKSNLTNQETPMKFIISRTSEWGDDSPHNNAKKEFVEHWRTRTCSEDEFNKIFSSREGLWRNKGKDHTVTEKGYIKRRESDVEVWIIEINTLEELIKLSSENQIIVGPISEMHNLPTIEIYDDYRE